ncbi:MAG: right-handed parallel beta-helix repeat-containing protein [Cyanobacteria bacterium J06621_8]
MSNFSDNIIGETGIVSDINHNSQTIFFDNKYSDPVIFAQPLSYNGNQAAIVRIEDIQSDRFTASIQETSNLDGKHINESFSYLVLEKGTWQLENDTLLEVGTVDTNLLSSDGWENIDFTHDFTENPLVFSQVQTDNDPDFVRTRQRNTNTSGFEITMQEEEARNHTAHLTESVGWLAISAGSGNWSNNSYLAGQTGNSVSHNWHTIDFEDNLTQSPVLLASIATYNGADPAGLRSSNLSSNQVDIKIEEDTSKDTEVSHNKEAVNFFAITGNDFLRGIPLSEGVFEENSEIIDEGKWDVIYDGLNQSEPLNIVGMQNVLIINSTFNNVQSGDAIYIRDSDNVHIENVTINNTINNDAIDIRYSDDVYIDDIIVNKISGASDLSGVRIWQSTDIIIEDSEFSRIFSPGHSAGIKIARGELTANVTIDNNHVYNTYGNGIVSGGGSAALEPNQAHDTPNPGLRITNNLIHDIGKTPSPRANSPVHGLYIKAQDAYIAGNTVYNSFDGEGISIRSTAVVIDNKIWDTKLAALAFYQDAPAGPSQKSVIKNNELFFTENRPKADHGAAALLRLHWTENYKNSIQYDTFKVRNNKLSINTEEIGNPALINLYSFDNLTLVGNDFIDKRARTRFFQYIGDPLIRYEERNTNSFNEV